MLIHRNAEETSTILALLALIHDSLHPRDKQIRQPWITNPRASFLWEIKLIILIISLHATTFINANIPLAVSSNEMHSRYRHKRLTQILIKITSVRMPRPTVIKFPSSSNGGPWDFNSRSPDDIPLDRSVRL